MLKKTFCTFGKKPSTILAAIAFLVMALSSCAQNDPRLQFPTARAGVLDLRAWDFPTKDPVPLAGEWKFYPGELIPRNAPAHDEKAVFRTVPDMWRTDEGGGADGQGSGTYELRVLLSPNAGNLAVRYLTVATAFELDVDGQTIANAGKPAQTKEDAVPAYRPGATRVIAHEDVLNIRVRVSNHEYRTGGMWRSFSLGSLESVRSEKRQKDFVSIVLFAGIGAAALNSMFLFMFRKRERSHLWFALFALTVAIRPLVSGEYLLGELMPWLSFDFLVRLEYLTVFLPLPLALLFFVSIFPDVLRRLWRMVLLLPSAPFLLATLILPLPILTRIIFAYYPLALLGMIAILVFVLIRAVAKKHRGSITMLFGGLLVGAAALNDILYNSFYIPTGNLLALSLAVFVVLQLFVLAQKFTDAFITTESLSSKVSETNALLELEVARYRETHKKLESLLDEKETLLMEVHHRVKNSLQIVSSIISLQSYRIEDPVVLAAYRSMKDRIRAISLVHEKLYTLSSGEMVDLGSYARDLIHLLASSYNADHGNLHAEITTERIDVPIDFCVDAGLILTEVVANAFKHAVMPKGKGNIFVDVRLIEDTVHMEVADEGPGFPDGFLPENATTLGFRVMMNMLQRRGGACMVTSLDGAHVSVVIPLETSPSAPKIDR